MHTHMLRACSAGPRETAFSEDPFTQAALTENAHRAKHSHAAGFIMTAIGSMLFLKLIRSIARAGR